MKLHLYWILSAVSSLALLAVLLRPFRTENCDGNQHFNIRYLASFQNPLIKESSGICPDGDGGFFTHNDDTDSCLYRFGWNGDERGKICIPSKNQDWEEICRATDGRIFVGDFGNNLNRRKNLHILILHPGKEELTEKLWFDYPEQEAYPPMNPMDWDFDCEAMVFHQDSLWLFSKNKDAKSSSIYVLPAKNGRWPAQKIGTVFLQGTVTGAALRPDGKELALLIYRKIYFFSLRNSLREISSPDICLPAWKLRQTEAICYAGKDSLILSNEQGQIYLIMRK